MNHWKASIDISKEWKEAQSDPDTIKNLCEVMVLKLRTIPKRLQDTRLENIIGLLNKFNPDLQDADDFDLIMNYLYDWADEDKKLWIDTFGGTHKSATPN